MTHQLKNTIYLAGFGWQNKWQTFLDFSDFSTPQIRYSHLGSIVTKLVLTSYPSNPMLSAAIDFGTDFIAITNTSLVQSYQSSLISSDNRIGYGFNKMETHLMDLRQSCQHRHYPTCPKSE